MKYAVEMGSGAVMYISGLIKIGSGIHKLIHTQHGDRIALLLFLHHKEIRLIKLQKYLSTQLIHLSVSHVRSKFMNSLCALRTEMLIIVNKVT
jgi:hypothetical protein